MLPTAVNGLDINVAIFCHVESVAVITLRTFFLIFEWLYLKFDLQKEFHIEDFLGLLAFDQMDQVERKQPSISSVLHLCDVATSKLRAVSSSLTSLGPTDYMLLITDFRGMYCH